MQKTNGQTIFLIGGTTEANEAAGRLQEEGLNVIVSVATPLGAAVAADAGLQTETGRKDAAAMAAGAAGLGCAAIVDCSHPFAREASRQARAAAAIAGLPYFRVTRPPWRQVATGKDQLVQAATGKDQPLRAVDSFEAAATRLKADGNRSFLTIGTRNLEPFVEAGLDFTARILPLSESFEDCRRLGIKPRNIIAAWPPFTVDFNCACLRHSGATALVTKDSGREGGLDEKLQAAELEGAAVILVRRPAEPDAIHDLDVLARLLSEALAGGCTGGLSAGPAAATAAGAVTGGKEAKIDATGSGS